MNFKRTVKKMALKIKKHSPEILMVVGTASLIGAVGTAIWKTATCDEILDEHEKAMSDAKDHIEESKRKIDELKAAGKRRKNGDKIVYTDEQAEADLKGAQMKIWMKTIGKIAWHYAPTIALTGLSATSFLGAFCIIRGRYTALAGAFAATTSAFENYRRRVIEDVGEDKDFEYRYGMRKETVKVVNPETGKKEEVEVYSCDEDAEETVSDGFFTFEFDERSGEWYRDMQTNVISLNGIRATMDCDLQAYGFITAKDIFKRLDVWDYLTKEQRRAALRFGYYDDGKTHVDFNLYSPKNKDAIMRGDGHLCDRLILELKGLRPLDTLID